MNKKLEDPNSKSHKRQHFPLLETLEITVLHSRHVSETLRHSVIQVLVHHCFSGLCQSSGLLGHPG